MVGLTLFFLALIVFQILELRINEVLLYSRCSSEEAVYKVGSAHLLNKKYSKDKFIAADVILVELFAISI